MSIFKQLGSQDIVSTKTLLHEAIPLTGTILSGAYGKNGSERNIKNFSHGMFQSVYDYPYLSSSANHILDITIGYHSDSVMSGNANTHKQNAKKINIYNQMAQVLMGYDKDGNIQAFDEDGDLTGGRKIKSAYFLSFSRLLVKDEVKKGSFSMQLGVGSYFDGSSSYYASDVTTNPAFAVTIADTNAATNYRVNSPAGEYGVLYATETTARGNKILGNDTAIIGSNATTNPVGLIYYQAGIAVLTSSIFLGESSSFGKTGLLAHENYPDTQVPPVHSDQTRLHLQNPGTSSAHTVHHAFISGSISGSADGLRTRIQNLQFNNTIELNSTIHFCRLNHNEFNYSANPTYLTGSQLRVKQNNDDNPVSYITSIGLYSADNQLLAVGKLSEPIRKDPTIELTFRARLDY
tara:strand:+ start:1441 stop:2658 length:1218 start_codon:yes stop_codon:yes gene_type:complete